MSDKNLSVVIVEDDNDICDIVMYRLKISGFDVAAAHDGISGLELIRRKKPAAVLLDIGMTGMDGLEVLAELKKDSRTANVIVIMMTAAHFVSDMERAFECGADDYITKPFEDDDIARIVKKKIEKNMKGKHV